MKNMKTLWKQQWEGDSLKEKLSLYCYGYTGGWSAKAAIGRRLVLFRIVTLVILTKNEELKDEKPSVNPKKTVVHLLESVHTKEFHVFTRNKYGK